MDIKAFSPHLRSFFLEKGKRITYKKSEMVQNPSHPIAGVFYIEKGFVRVYGYDLNGKEITISFLNPGSILSKLGTLSKDYNLPVYYETYTPTTLYRINKELFKQHLETDIVSSLEQSSLGYLYVTYHINQFFVLQTKPSQFKILVWIDFMSQYYAEDVGKSKIFLFPLSQELISGMLQISREIVSTELKKLRDRKIISYHKKRICINDYLQFCSILEEYYLHHVENPALPYQYLKL